VVSFSFTEEWVTKLKLNLWEKDNGFEFGDEKYEERWEIGFGLDNEMEENKDGWWWVGEKEVESITEEAAIFSSLRTWKLS